MYNKWAQSIIERQHPDGSWGYFHSLGQQAKAPITTEQALRRLRILGLTAEDEPIKRALGYLSGVLSLRHQPPDRREKVLNWDVFEAHMAAAWIRLFVPGDEAALSVARMWAGIVTAAFEQGEYNPDLYEKNYRQNIPQLHSNERLIALSQFYMVNLLPGMLDKATETRYVNYVLENPRGIYYVYNFRVVDLPPIFASRRTSMWLAAVEMLAAYPSAREKLQVAVDWIHSHVDGDGYWDLGQAARDGIYFPLSDSWRKDRDRKRDCTYRIGRLLERLG